MDACDRCGRVSVWRYVWCMCAFMMCGYGCVDAPLDRHRNPVRWMITHAPTNTPGAFRFLKCLPQFCYFFHGRSALLQRMVVGADVCMFACECGCFFRVSAGVSKAPRSKSMCACRCGYMHTYPRTTLNALHTDAFTPYLAKLLHQFSVVAIGGCTRLLGLRC